MSDAVEVIGEDRAGRFVVTCDHASNGVPADVAGGDLGVSAADMKRHIAYDPGARGVALALAEALDAPCVMARFSRLVIDPNRGEDDPTLVMQIYDGTIIPANRGIGGAEVERRLERFHRPYHRALERVIGSKRDPILVAVHSFTRAFRGRPLRPWHVGVLSSQDKRMAGPVVEHLRRFADLCVGDNEPYSGHLPGDAMDRHGIAPGRLHVLIEVRNDLIRAAPAQRDWGARLAAVLDAVVAEAEV